MARHRSPTSGHTRVLLLVVCTGSSACSGGDYWLGGGPGPGSGGASTSLVGDVSLSGPNAVEIGGGTAPCRIVGNGFQIRTDGTFSGRLWIHDCELVGLGSADKPAIDVEVSDPGSVVIERCTFSESGSVAIGNAGDTATTFQDNVVHDDAKIPLDPSQGYASNVFAASGESRASKLFRGNRIERGRVRFGSPTWLAGGDGDADSNVLLGLRAGFTLAASGLVVRGNYVHPSHLAGAGDESCIDTDYSVTDALAEHNVLRGGTWVVRGFGGEFRYNAVLDADNLAFVQQPFEGTRLHHNVLAMCTAPRGESPVQAGIELVNGRASGIEIYGNTLDGGGDALRFGGPAVSIESGSLLASLRSNLVERFYFSENLDSAAIRPGPTEDSTPPPARLGYADYNLFDNEGEATPQNYVVSVPGHRVRVDAGFGLNDVTPGGSVDEQVAPDLGGTGNCIAPSDDAVLAGQSTVSSNLAALRARYAPLPTSPILDAGDPADGPDNFIGAVGDGSLASDQFGRFGG